MELLSGLTADLKKASSKEVFKLLDSIKQSVLIAGFSIEGRGYRTMIREITHVFIIT